jgi:hypothetical protein
MTMKLWLLKPLSEKPWVPWYDKCFGMVVRAATEPEARRWASMYGGDEGEEPWLNPSDSTCVELLADYHGAEPGPILIDIHSA